MQKATVNDKNGELLHCLLEVSDDMQESVINDFISALKSSDQEHVANIFRRESNKVPMSEEHYNTLRGNIHRLCQFADPENGLLDKLVSNDIISLADAESIRSMIGYNEMSRKLIEILTRKSDDAFVCFVDALCQTGQSHVACILTGKSDKVPMSDIHRRTLMVKTDQLCQCIDPENGLLDKLVSTKVISSMNAECIRSVAGYNKMSRKLIEFLTRKSDEAFDGFINALNQTGQSHITDILTGEDNTPPLKDEHIKRLTSKRDYLVNTIDSKCSNLVTALMSRGVFSKHDEERVTHIKTDTNYDRNELILNLISRKSQSDFFKFLSALNDTDQTHVVVSLIGADVVAKIVKEHKQGTDSGHMPYVDSELVKYMREMFQINGDVVRRIDELLSCNGVVVTNVSEGCIEITFTCESVESLQHFRELYDSGELGQMVNEAFCPEFANSSFYSLKLIIPDEQFKHCASTFYRWVPMTSAHRKALMSSEESLLRTMTVSDDLLDKLSLCRRRKQTINQAAAAPEQQVKTLLDIVSRQPDSAFAQLLNALRDTGQYEAAAIIGGDGD